MKKFCVHYKEEPVDFYRKTLTVYSENDRKHTTHRVGKKQNILILNMHLPVGFKQLKLCSLFQVLVLIVFLFVVTYAQLPHYPPIHLGHHIEEYHHVGTKNKGKKGIPKKYRDHNRTTSKADKKMYAKY